MSKNEEGNCTCVKCAKTHKCYGPCPHCNPEESKPKTRRRMNPKLILLGGKVTGIFFFILSIILAIEMIWHYDLDLLFLFSYVLMMVGLGVGGSLIAIATFTQKSRGQAINLELFETTNGSCHKCLREGVVLYPKGLNDPAMYRCVDHLDSLIM